MKKRIISILLVFAIAFGAMLGSLTAASAATCNSPKMNVVRGKDGFNVVWNKVSNTKVYRLYLGVNYKWRCYTDIYVSREMSEGKLTTHPKYTQSFQLFINWDALHYRKWTPYGQEAGIPTPRIVAPNSYQTQIEVLNGKKQHLYWTNVDYALFGTPTLSKKTNGNSLTLSWASITGATSYRIAHRSKSSKSYDYTFIPKRSITSYTFNAYGNPKEDEFFQIQPCITRNNSVYEYGEWSKTLIVKPIQETPSTNTQTITKIPQYGDCVATLTAETANMYGINIILGVDQDTIDNYEIGMYYNTVDLFRVGMPVTLFGHNNKSMGRIKNLKSGNKISLYDKIHNKTINYQVYYTGNCTRSSDMKYMVDYNTGKTIDPFIQGVSDLYLITCHDYMINTNRVVIAKRLN